MKHILVVLAVIISTSLLALAQKKGLEEIVVHSSDEITPQEVVKLLDTQEQISQLLKEEVVHEKKSLLTGEVQREIYTKYFIGFSSEEVYIKYTPSPVETYWITYKEQVISSEDLFKSEPAMAQAILGEMQEIISFYEWE